MPKLRRPPRGAKIHQPTTAQHPSQLQKIWRWIGGAITVLVCISGLLTFYPALTVDVGSPLDANNPFSYPFIVTNDTILPLFNVNISCHLDNVLLLDGGRFSNGAIKTEQTLSIMVPHQKTTAPCHRAIYTDSPATRGIVAIAVSYYPFLWPIKTSTTRYFGAEMTADKKTIWLPQ